MTTASKITLARILLIPAVVVVFLVDFTSSRIVAAVLFAIVALSDLLDGYVARKYNQVSDLGKFLDPIADKILVAVFMFLLVQENLLYNPIGSLVCGVVMSREFIITAFRMHGAAKNKVIPADVWGKLKTDFLDIGIAVVIFTSDPLWKTNGGTVWDVWFWLNFIGLVCFFTGSLLAIISGVNYIIKNRDILLEENNDGQNL